MNVFDVLSLSEIYNTNIHTQLHIQDKTRQKFNYTVADEAELLQRQKCVPN